jgi:hypothetical protein
MAGAGADECYGDLRIMVGPRQAARRTIGLGAVKLRDGPAPNPGRTAANPKLPQPRQDAVLERQSPVAGSETK